MGIHAKCYRVDNQSYKRYGARGIKVDPEWHRDNSQGLQNFIDWLTTQLADHGNPEKYAVVLDDQAKHFGPSNCLVRSQQFAIQRRDMNAHSVTQVTEMRQYKRTHPEATLEDIVGLFGGTISSVSQALTGVTYSNLNDIEPPLNVDQIRKGIKATTGKRSRATLPVQEQDQLEPPTTTVRRLYRSGQLMVVIE
jgi:hypothetical protein